ncbi:ceramide glucosyltransferase [Roseomonas sp. OT10]|uniref:ceramide glucosyltransferase n=1 Tax=Roseomonas cutis TaxID=2897332 RepID=UPI001E64C2C0|nr:ceramide glucosyltransferase [Roseomonas sp. OT10]UFN47279.1 ceramide glucosyltransferase [Roseomonas sp. OT10]
MSAASLALVACLLLVAVNLGSLALAALRLRPRPRLPRPPAGTEPVSIVRPVCGAEPFLAETLGSGFRLDHPAYELVFCAARADDPAVPVVRRLMAANPAIPSRLLLGDDPVSGNPKLNNCVKGWRAARHDWVVLADSNVLMPPDYLQRLRAAWRPDSGLVCSTPLGTRALGFWAGIEAAFLNTLQARWQYAGERLGRGFAQGKSMLWHRPTLESLGGIAALGAEIAEDAAATKLVRRAGLRVHLVDDPFAQPLGRRTAAQVWSRQARWARLRRVTFPGLFLLEGLVSAILAALLGMLAAGLSGHPAWAAAASILLLSYGAEAWLARSKGWEAPWWLPAAALVRDAMVLGLWVHGWAGDRVTWRGNTMDVQTAALSPGGEGGSGR